MEGSKESANYFTDYMEVVLDGGGAMGKKILSTNGMWTNWKYVDD